MHAPSSGEHNDARRSSQHSGSKLNCQSERNYVRQSSIGGMEGTEYGVMLSGSDRYYVELNRQGELSCTTCDFSTQSAAQNWIDQDREREGALDRRWQVASRRWPWWMHLWWRV